MDSRDRRAELLKPASSFNGIDFVEIADEEQTDLRVHFLNSVPLQGTVSPTPTIEGGEAIRTVAVTPFNDETDWSLDGGHLVLRLAVAAPGDFSNYTLRLQSVVSNPVLDSFFDHATFSFKARCRSRLDCEPKPPVCPPVEANVPPINYLAKDFLSFRQALLDFSSLRYPQWQERSEADFGMMFAEALSALADDLSYTQDRISAEATLETATQRRSVVRLARLVDYEPRPATIASVMLQFDVAPGVKELPDGLVVSGRGPDGAVIPFETGTSLQERLLTGANSQVRRDQLRTWPTSSAWNAGIKPYWFDDSERCLRAGATEMYLAGHGYDFQAGQALLIETAGATSADPPLRQIVRLKQADFEFKLSDPIFLQTANSLGPPYLTVPPSPVGSIQPSAVTRISWEAADKLKADRDLTKTTLAGNLIPATQGLTRKASSSMQFAEQFTERFAIPSSSKPPLDLPLAVVRTGANDNAETPSLQYLYSLKTGPLAWLPQENPEDFPLPEILVTCHAVDGSTSIWPFLRRLLDAETFAEAFTIDPARFSPIALIRDSSNPTSSGALASAVSDYDGDGGDSIRFGDGVFGQEPLPDSTFEVIYRVGAGAAGNVAADTINQIGPDATQDVRRVTNPLPASGGSDPEPLDRVRRRAPQQFRAVQYRAVLPADYENAAARLPWVQRAGTVFRWTGSWQTVFTTADPLQSEQITTDERIELINLLNRYRMAGYESYVPEAVYVSLDVIVELCARSDAFRADVAESVLERLTGTKLADDSKGFFHPDNFSFGQALERSRLEQAIQEAAGVAGVSCISFRVRGRTAGFSELPDIVAVASYEIIRCDNDPSFPERGSLKIIVGGGK